MCRSGLFAVATIGAAALGMSAAAEVVVLDFATEGQAFNGDDRYAVSTQNLHWWGSGYGSEGVLFAWDMENAQAGLGRLAVSASEGFTVTGLSFDLSGYLDFEAAARWDFFVDGNLVATGDNQFLGQESLVTFDLGAVTGSNFELVIDNYGRPAYVGLDNVSFNIAPAPGAMALLGLAGLAGNRRRRG